MSLFNDRWFRVVIPFLIAFVGLPLFISLLTPRAQAQGRRARATDDQGTSAPLAGAQTQPRPEHVAQTATCAGDLSGDGVRDAQDLSIIVGLWRQSAAAPYDTDGDGRVLVFDILSVAALVGTSCPTTPPPIPTPTPTLTVTPTPSPIPTDTPTLTPTNTPTSTSVATDTPTPTPTATSTPTSSPTPLTSPTPEPSPTATPVTGARLPVVNVPSTISSDTTWSAGNVYLLSGQTRVNAGVTLTIEPGAVVKFQNSGSTRGKLIVNGSLLAQGTADTPILFTSIHDDTFGGDTNQNGGATWPNAGDWDGLAFGSSSDGSRLEHVFILYGGTGSSGAAVTVTGANVLLTHSTVRYSGGDGLRWFNGASGQIVDNNVSYNLSNGMYIKGNSSPIVQGNTIAHNRQNAIYLEGNSFPGFANNTVYGNATNGIRIYGTVGSGTWYPNLPYVANEDIVVESGSTLTLQPGTVVKLSTNQDFIVRGALVARGTVTDTIVFTSLKDDIFGGDTQQDGAVTKPNPGDWGTLYFADTSNDATSVLDYVIIRYGGAGYNYGSGTAYADLTLDTASPRVVNSTFEHSSRYGVQLLNVSSPTFQNNTVMANADHGLWISPNSAPQVRDNVFARNGGYAVYVTGSSQAVFGGNTAAGNRVNGIGMGGALNTDTTWEYDLPYVVDGNLTLNLNTTLTIQPGVVVKFTAGAKFAVNGNLQAQGTADHRIVFTSLKDDSIAGDINGDGIATAPAPGDWESIRFASTAGSSSLDYVTVRYGGSNASTGAVILDGSTPTLGHLVIMGSRHQGLYVQNASPFVENAIFSENEVGVYNGSTAYLIIRNSDIYSNTQYGLYNANASYDLNATDNWWGDASGPTHNGNSGGTGDRVSDNVTYSPWHGTPPVPEPTPLPSFPSPPTYTQVSGAITANTTWSLSQSPIIVVGDVTINPGVQLSIEPGVVVKFAAGKSLIVNGILDAQGTADSRIIFTSIKDDGVGGDANADGSATWPRPGDWGRIAFGDSSVDALTKLRYAEIRYGGGAGSAVYVDSASPTIADNLIVRNAGYGLHIRNQAAPTVQGNWILDNTSGGIKLESTSSGTISGNRFWGNGGYAVYMDASCYPAFSGNEAYYNDINGVRVSGSVTFNQTWYADLVYVIEGGLTVNSGPALTLQPGTVVKFKDTGSYLTVNGALVADGTDSAPIVFTSMQDDTYGGDTDNDDGITWPAPGDWRRIMFTDSSDDSRSILRHVIVRYGGYYYNNSLFLNSAAPRVISSTIAYGQGHGLYLDNQANPLIQGNTFLQNGGSGLYLTNASAPTVQDNIFRRNKSYAVEMTANTKPRFSGNTAVDNMTNGVKVSGTVSGTTSWDADMVYVGAVTIPSNATLTLRPGIIVKLPPDTFRNWKVNGVLVAHGTGDDPIVFTSLKDDSYGGDTNNDGIATTPAPGDWCKIWVNSGHVKMNHVILQYGGSRSWCGGTTIYLEEGAFVELDHVTVANSAGNGIELSSSWGVNGSSLVIVSSNIESNAGSGIYSHYLTHQKNDYHKIYVHFSKFYGNMDYGLYATSAEAVLDGNIFMDNGSYAAYIDTIDNAAITISNNTGTGNAKNGIEISGSTSVSTYLGANTDLPYVVSGSRNLRVSSGTTLTLYAGTIIKVESDGGIYVDGTLQTNGTAENPVYITSIKDDTVAGDTNGDGASSTPRKGDWEGIYVSGGSLNLNHTIVRYSGGTLGDAVVLMNKALGRFNYVHISYNAGNAIRLSGSSLENSPRITMSDSVIKHNAEAGIHANNFSEVNVSKSEISNNGSYGIDVWDSIQLDVSESCICGNGSSGIFVGTTGIGPDSGGITLTNNTLSNNASYAASLHLSSDKFVLSLHANEGKGNSKNGIALSGFIGTSTYLGPTSNLAYVIRGVLQLTSGATVTLHAGTILKLESGSGIYIDGALQVDGTEENPVYITSIKDDSVGGDTNGDGMASTPSRGDWGRLFIRGGTLNLNHAVVRYGGAGSWSLSGMITQNHYSYSGYVCYDAYISINNSSLSHSATDAINLRWEKGVSVVVTIMHNLIHNNAGYGIYNVMLNHIDARYNWWGSDSGPYHPTLNPSGTGDRVSDGVDFIPWTGQQYWTQSQLGRGGPTSRVQAFEAEPVNTANGNYTYSHTDLTIPTRGLPLDFTRTYNSLASQPGPLGYGWTHTWNLGLTENITDSTVIITFGDGHAEKWTWNGSTYEGAAGVFGTLVKNNDGTFDLTQKDQTVYHFTADGKLAWAEDKNGNRTTLIYDAQGRLVRITGPASRTLTLSYTSPISNSLISNLTDPAGRTITFTYNITGEFTLVTDTLGYTTTMTYNGDHRLLTITDANSHTFVRNVYDTKGRVVEQYDALGNKWTFAYDEPNHKTVVTDPRGHTTTNQYDSEWRLSSEKDALNQTASYAYDADNNRTQVTDKRGNTTRYDYDDRGNVLVITDTLGFTRTFTYDGRNNLLSRTDALGRTTTYTYDAHSNLVQMTDALGNITTYAYDSFGQLTSVTDALGRTTTYAYNGYGDLTSTIDPLGHTTTATFDNVGRKLSQTDALGRTTSYTYDNANRLLTVTEPLDKVTAYTYDAVGNRIAITDPLGHVTTFTYDAKDRLVSTTDPLGHTTTRTYDSVDNLISVTDPLGHTTTYAYDALNRRTSATDPLGHTTTYTYDANGNRISVTDTNGNTTTYMYDARNQLIAVTDAAGGTVSYTYDAVGNRTAMTDANGHTTTYAYDALDRLLSSTDPLGHVTSYTYDAVGNRISQTKADGTVITYAYDALDRLTATSYPGGSVTYAYDAVGNRTAMTDTVGVTTYTYDALNRLIQVTQPTGVLTYTYDLAGNHTGIIYPDGSTVTYNYDAANRLLTVTDRQGRVTTYSYDAAGRQTAIQYPNGVQAVYTYDDANRLLSVVHTSPVSGTIVSVTYTLDAVGNRLSMTDQDGTTSYSYDSLYRLTGVTYPDGEEVTYTYDPMGNRTAMTSTVSGVITYTYDAGDRLLAAGPITFTWDANGNMTGKGGATYTFDPLDRLTQVVSGTTTVVFAYNGDGVRLRKTVNGTTAAYLQDVAVTLPVVLNETTGGQTTAYVYGNDLISRYDPTGIPSFYHADGLGSTRALSNLSGRHTDAYSYDVFGAERSHSGSSVQPFTFTGEQVDGEIGLVFLRMRYYDPAVGRFISRDSFPAIARKTQTINRYVYVQNNPVRLTDPSGNAWYDIFDANKNGLNAFIGKHIAPHIPIVKDLIKMNEGLDQYAKNRRRALELITPNMTEEDEREFEEAQRAAVQGLRQGLSSASKAAMSAPCTSFNPSCGLTSFLPKPIGDIVEFVKNPFAWLLGKGKDAVVDPIYDIPSLSVEHQFRMYAPGPGQRGYMQGTWTVSSSSWGWGAPPSQGK